MRCSLLPAGKLRGFRESGVCTVRRFGRGDPQTQTGTAGFHQTEQGDEAANSERPGIYMHMQASAHYRSASVLHRGAQRDGFCCFPAGKGVETNPLFLVPFVSTSHNRTLRVFIYLTSLFNFKGCSSKWLLVMTRKLCGGKWLWPSTKLGPCRVDTLRPVR